MTDRAAIMREAQKLLAKGKIDEAIAEWEKLAKTQPDANTFNTIGDLFMKKGDKEKAVEYLHKAASVFRDDGFSLKGLAIYKKVLNIKPNDADALFALGELNEEKDIKPDAIKYYLASADILSKENKKDRLPKVYQKIINVSAKNIPLRTKISEMYSKEGFVTEAAREYTEIAKLYADNGDLNESKKFFNKALEIQPRELNALIGLCRLAEDEGDIEKALELVKAAIERGGQNVQLQLKAAQLLISTGSYAEAAEHAKQASEIDPSNIDAKKLVGDIYKKTGDMQKAWDIYKNVLDEIIYNERFDEAITIVNEFKELDPIESRKKLVSLYNQTGETESAFSELRSLAEYYHEKGSMQEALNCYKEASSMMPDDEGITAHIKEIESTLGVKEAEVKEKPIDEALTEADIFLRYGLYNEAQTLLESVKVKAPENIDVHLKLKTLYKETNNTELAVTECIILAELYGRADNSEQRSAIINEAFGINPEDPRLSEKFGAPEPAAAPQPEQTVSEEEAPQPSGESIDDYSEELSEADFYVKEGLYGEASEIYKKLSEKFPENEYITGKLSELQSYTEETITAPPAEETHPAEVTPPEEEDAFAGIGEGEEQTEEEEGMETFSLDEFAPQEMEALEAQEMGEPAFDDEVMGIFDEFKKGLEKELEAEDSETHYNLGIAYKEMGLVDDAIKAFQTVKQDPKYHIQASTMLGICYMQKGLYPLAIDAFTGALMKMGTKDEAHWGLKYDLAEAYEKNGNIKEALDFYTEVYGWNSLFRDVSDKISTLKGKLNPEEKRATDAKSSTKPGDEPPESKGKKSRVSYI